MSDLDRLREALQKRLNNYRRDERSLNHVEANYWRKQFKQLAVDAIAAFTQLANKPDSPSVRETPLLCACKDRPAKECPGEWEPGCDLGNNEAHVKVADPQPIVTLSLPKQATPADEVLSPEHVKRLELDLYALWRQGHISLPDRNLLSRLLAVVKPMPAPSVSDTVEYISVGTVDRLRCNPKITNFSVLTGLFANEPMDVKVIYVQKRK